MTARMTERQLEVMNVLWEAGGATCREVMNCLEGDQAYTSYLTILQTLEKNGLVRSYRDPEMKRRYIYEPIRTRKREADLWVEALKEADLWGMVLSRHGPVPMVE